MKKTLTINALSHCDWKDCPEQLVKEAEGGAVILVREEENIDPLAVRAHFRGTVAGYVCHDDAGLARQLMGSRTSVLAHVVAGIREPYYKLRVEVETQTDGMRTIDERLNRPYDEWQYTGPLLPPSLEQKYLEGAVAYLGFVMEGELLWDKEANEYYEVFLRCHRQDFSDEVFHFRHQLMKFFESHSQRRHEARRLEAELHEMTKHEHHEQLIAFISGLVDTPEFDEMMERQSDIDMAQISAELAAFPGNMVALMDSNPNLFCKRLYYIHPHREVLQRLFSAISIVLFDFRQRHHLLPKPSSKSILPQKGQGALTLHAENVFIGNSQHVAGNINVKKDTSIDRNYGPVIDNHEGGKIGLQGSNDMNSTTHKDFE